MARRRRLAGALAVALVATGWLLLAGAPSGASAPVHPRAFIDGTRFEGKTTFTVDPAGGSVHVAFDATITNERPDRVVGGSVQQFYLPTVGVPLLAEVVGLSAVKSDGTPLAVSTEASDNPRFRFAVVDLRPNLFFGDSQTFRLTYDLPRVAPRSPGFTRINDAYATFAVLAVGDPGLADVEVVIPTRFEAEIVGDDMTRSERDGQQVFTATAIDDPRSWFVQVAARDDDELVERTVALGDDEVRVLGWPDDPTWADFAASQVEDGVPAIEGVLGLRWPITSTLDIVETASPYLYGYAGWYQRSDDLIEIGDQLDQQVILHELSHVWFNETLFRDRWINEAFANQAAALAMAELGSTPPTPEPIDPADPGRLRLNDWSAPDLQAALSDDQERYGYNASWAVLDGISEEIGADRLAAVVQAADVGQSAYRGPGDTSSSTHVYDWRELLDLLEEVGGSASAAELFQRHVVSESQAPDLAARATARTRYAALVEAGDGWAAPRFVRQALADWRFATAEELMAGATEVLATKAEVVEVAADLEVSDDLALQDDYERAADVTALEAEADGALDAARALQAAEDARDEGHGLLGAVGLLFSSVDERLAEAASAFDEGDYDAVLGEADRVQVTVDRAPLTGFVRLVGVVGLLLLALLLRRVLRRARAERVLQADGAEGVGGPSDGGRQRGV